MTLSRHLVTQQTKSWVKEVVIGLNLCPFAAQPFNNDAIEYFVDFGNSAEHHLQHLAEHFSKLDESADIETSLLIYPDAYQAFDDYLDFLYLANRILDDLDYTGTYQVASFHPDYRFEGSAEDDASNFSNRSPYPMLHLIREQSLEIAIANYPNVEQVPDDNIKRLRQIGYEEMRNKLEKITTYSATPSLKEER